MKKRAVTLLLCLVLVVLSLLRGFAASAAGIIPATNADFDVPCAAAILIDEDSGTVLYEKNADARRPIASITKVMTLLLAFEALEAGKIHLDDFVPVSEHAYHMGGSQIWLEPGDSRPDPHGCRMWRLRRATSGRKQYSSISYICD